MSESFLFKMPDIGEGVVEGEVISWLKNEGDAVAKDEPVVVVMTDKATVELPTPYAGILTKQFYKPGEIAKKDLPLFEVEVEGRVAVENNKQPETKADPVPPASKKTSSDKALAAPFVRKLAKEMGISLGQIEGHGPDGRVLADDLKQGQKQAVESGLAHLEGDTETPLRGIQNLMAKKMVESSRTIPHFSYFDQADATRLVQLLNNMRAKAEEENIKLTFMPFFIKALSLVIKKYPILNSSVDAIKNSILQHKVQNIGIAMSTPLGLIVPNLKNVQAQSITDIIYDYEKLKEKGMKGKLSPADMKEGTISITNFGALIGKGVFATPIINCPESAILGLSRIHKQPIIVGDEERICDILNCSWSFDHRIIDGEMAVKASREFVRNIENPASLL